MMDKRERIRGSLLCGAIGDAFGYPVEFLSGPDAKIREYVIDRESGKAVISDDTQMTLFTACGLLYGYSRFRMRGIGGNPAIYIRSAYFDWLETQGYKAEEHPRVSWIYSIPELHCLRAPGNTCLSALQKGGGSIKEPINNSKGCGAVMRIAPIPLYCAGNHLMDKEKTADLCADASAITHCHPLGWLSSVALGIILYDLMCDASLDDAVADTIDFLRKKYADYPDAETMAKLIEKTKRLADLACRSNSDDLTGEFGIMKELGEGWVGEEALAVGLFSVLACRERGFDQCLYNAACHKGDSDSTASIAGQIWGAAYGLSRVDEKWLKNLELREVILEIADDLTDNCKMSEYGDYYDPVWDKKYIRVKE